MSVKRFDGQPDELLAVSDKSRRKLADALKDTESANEILGPERDQILFHLEQFRSGVSAPEDVTVGTSPLIHVLRFHDLPQRLSGHIVFPKNMDKTKGAYFVLQIMLSTIQNEGDTLDLIADYVLVKNHIPGNGYNKASRQITTSVTFTAKQGLGVGDIYEAVFYFPPHDGGNGLIDSDGVGIGFYMANLDEVSEFYFASAYLDYMKLK